MKEADNKITLPEELQKEMLKFFLKTSIPRKKREKNALLSKKEIDKNKENVFDR